MESDEKVVKLLVDEGKVQKKDLIGVFKIHQANKAPLEILMVQLKAAKREDVLQAKAKINKCEPFLIELDKIDIELAKNIPQALAKRYNIVTPGKTDDDKIIVAMHNPLDTFALEYVQMRTGKEIKPYIALLADLEDAWEVIYAPEQRKKHPFFTKQAQDPVMQKKPIPTKFTIPGLSTRSTVVVENKEKAQLMIKEATDMLREKDRDDKDFNAVVDNVQKEFDALSLLSQTAILLNSVMEEEKVILKILETGAQLCKSQCGSILVTEDRNLYFKEALGSKRDQLLKVRIPLTEKSVAGWVAIHKVPVAINNIKEDPRHYKEIDEILAFETRNLICVPLMWGEDVIGVMELLNKTEGEYNEKDLEYLSILGAQASIALHNTIMTNKFRNFYMEVVDILMDCLESVAPGSREHSVQVSRLAGEMARMLRMPLDDSENIRYSAFLHDIGKIITDPNNMQEHCKNGAQMLSKVKFFHGSIPIIEHHHERFDGQGYPDTLSGESIPTGARILSIANAYFDTRKLKQDMSDEEFIEEFCKEFGTAFDPGLKLVFMSAISELQRGICETEECRNASPAPHNSDIVHATIPDSTPKITEEELKIPGQEDKKNPDEVMSISQEGLKIPEYNEGNIFKHFDEAEESTINISN